MTTLTLRVTGTPTPQGSKKGFVNPKTGRAIIVDDNKKPLKDWRGDVRKAALDAIANHNGGTIPPGEAWPFPLNGPITVTVCFYIARPKYHYRSGKHAHELRPDAPVFVDKKPDGDKLVRAIFDALTSAGVYGDDAQVVIHHAEKRYTAHGQPPGALITIRPATPPEASEVAAVPEEQGVLL